MSPARSSTRAMPSRSRNVSAPTTTRVIQAPSGAHAQRGGTPVPDEDPGLAERYHEEPRRSLHHPRRGTSARLPLNFGATRRARRGETRRDGAHHPVERGVHTGPKPRAHTVAPARARCECARAMSAKASKIAATTVVRARRQPGTLGIPEARIEPIRSGRRRIVARPRLFESLSSAVASRRLTLVAAPPGAGKSTLLSSWLDAGGAPARTAWLTVDESDNRPERFWQAVVVALDRAGWRGAEELATAAAAISSKSAPGEFPALLGEAIEDVDEPSVLVLDDFQEVSDDRVLAGIAQLLKVAPAGFRLVVASRRDPPLPLHRLRLAGQLAELRAAPLAFTPAEARQLLAGQGLVLSNADVESLVVRTEGWAGALTLASLALRETDDPSRVIRDFAGDDRAVADYLASEVLDALPDNLCDFLVRTSVADEVCGELVDALLEADGGGDVLADLERRNCFVIALDTRRKWYRYHRLFLELLRSRVATRPRRERDELHSRAARWHAENDRPVDAIRHA